MRRILCKLFGHRWRLAAKPPNCQTARWCPRCETVEIEFVQTGERETAVYEFFTERDDKGRLVDVAVTMVL